MRSERLFKSVRNTHTCHGDSGGPLIGRPDANAPWQQIGIVSWGEIHCGTYSVLQRVGVLLPFIRSYVADPAVLRAASEIAL